MCHISPTDSVTKLAISGILVSTRQKLTVKFLVRSAIGGTQFLTQISFVFQLLLQNTQSPASEQQIYTTCFKMRVFSELTVR